MEFNKYKPIISITFLSISPRLQTIMTEEYDTNAFMIFVIAILSIYVIIASFFLYNRIRRVIKKEPIVLVTMD